MFAKVDDAHFTISQRLDFFLFIAVSTGELLHTIDFISHKVTRGRWLLVKPGQIQQIDRSCYWDGFFVPISSEVLESAVGSHSSNDEAHLLMALQKMPSVLNLTEEQSQLCFNAIEQIALDAQLTGPVHLIEMLLKRQLHAIVLRLLVNHQANIEINSKPPVAFLLFLKFRRAIEDNFRQWHHVHQYLDMLGCSERTLARACEAISATTPKEMIDARLALEAKRLLTHTTIKSNRVASELGFDDASYFIKFFKRMAGYTPGEFKKRQGVVREFR
ncbi:helix-turn-helix domain-containing protein [Serratia sp. UGAL515B_01]|uniref:AraC family transcriptional regulator n=1 Tax=Serratia sp. UGAL515B_01 TaxID=2986763 RepID=UPI0029555E66|nr:helix-turn-helix domain-containing protein [Serratia sp. UGAL515B_01]WON78267.1 helix-turn-helix domain-containing protein [Serratia sp. UGAL515B_01]